MPVEANLVFRDVSYQPQCTQFAALSQVCEFTARFCIFSMIEGSLYNFKYCIRSILEMFGEDEADRFVQKLFLYIDLMQNDYDISRDRFMLLSAAVYCTGDRIKKETQYYQKWIDEWMTNDQEHFLSVIRTRKGTDLGRKMLKKLTGSTK